MPNVHHYRAVSGTPAGARLKAIHMGSQSDCTELDGQALQKFKFEIDKHGEQSVTINILFRPSYSKSLEAKA